MQSVSPTETQSARSIAADVVGALSRHILFSVVGSDQLPAHLIFENMRWRIDGNVQRTPQCGPHGCIVWYRCMLVLTPSQSTYDSTAESILLELLYRGSD